MNRSEHLQWCKDRANEYIEAGDANGAVVNMLIDLSKHEETAESGQGILAMMGIDAAQRGLSATRDWVNGFN